MTDSGLDLLDLLEFLSSLYRTSKARGIDWCESFVEVRVDTSIEVLQGKGATGLFSMD